MVEIRVRTIHEATADWKAEHSLDLYRDGVFVTSRGIVTGTREAAEAEAASLERGIRFDETYQPRRLPESITPEVGANIIASALVNGDSVSDVVAVTAQVAAETGKTTTTAEILAVFSSEGVRVDAEGWILA